MQRNQIYNDNEEKINEEVKRILEKDEEKQKRWKKFMPKINMTIFLLITIFSMMMWYHINGVIWWWKIIEFIKNHIN